MWVAERMGGRRRRAGGERREAVLDAAVGVIAERGYERARFSDVAEASGVAVSTLQYYFGSREDMVVEVFRRATELEVAGLEGAADGSLDPWPRLVALVDRSFERDEQAEIGWRVCIEFWRAAVRDPELRDESVRLYESWRAPFLEAIAVGVRQGKFKPRRPPEAIVTQLLATIDGVGVPLLLDHAYLDLAALRDAVVEDLAAVLAVADA